MKAERILHLTLLRKWFDKIASGEKVWEYREIKPYWSKRLVGKTFDEIYFKNGYSKNAPFMRVEFKGVQITKNHLNSVCYGIRLGRILEVKNYSTITRAENGDL